MTIFLVVVGFIIVFCLGFFLRVVLGRLSSYSGTMHVLREEDKIVYRLELSEDPYDFIHRDEIVIKVETSEEIPVRG